VGARREQAAREQAALAVSGAALALVNKAVPADKPVPAVSESAAAVGAAVPPDKPVSAVSESAAAVGAAMSPDKPVPVVSESAAAVGAVAPPDKPVLAEREEQRDRRQVAAARRGWHRLLSAARA